MVTVVGQSGTVDMLIVGSSGGNYLGGGGGGHLLVQSRDITAVLMGLVLVWWCGGQATQIMVFNKLEVILPQIISHLFARPAVEGGHGMDDQMVHMRWEHQVTISGTGMVEEVHLLVLV